MEFSVHVFEDGKLGGRVVPLRVSTKPPVKVLDVLRELLPNVDLPVQAVTMFALWCTSPLLELQLKPEQKVKSVMNRWQELLAKYTTATVDEAEDDIPVLTLRRNCFYPKPLERRLLLEPALKLLYNEAVFNISTYRYIPVRNQDYYDLAAAKACIDLGLYDAQRHTLERIKRIIEQFFTAQFIRPNFADNVRRRAGYDRRTYVTKRFLQEFERCSSLNLPMVQLYHRYLLVCWSMATYSAVFFKGAIGCPRRGLTLTDQSDIDVRIAINPDGVHIVHEEKNELLISFAFDQVSWDYEPAQREGEHEFASLYLEFDGEVGTRKVLKCKYLIEIFSRQAQLMDAMIGQCVQMSVEEEDRIAEMRRSKGDSSRGFDIPSLTTENKRSFDDVERLAKVVMIQTCVGGRCFPGLPKPTQLESIVPASADVWASRV